MRVGLGKTHRFINMRNLIIFICVIAIGSALWEMKAQGSPHAQAAIPSTSLTPSGVSKTVLQAPVRTATLPVKRVLTIKPGDTFFELLQDQGVPAGDAIAITRTAKRAFNTARIQPGNPIMFVFTPDGARLTKVAYQISARQRLVVKVSEKQITARKIVVRASDTSMSESDQSAPAATQPLLTRKPAPQIVAENTPAPEPRLQHVAVKIRKGQNLFTILRRLGVPPREIDACSDSLKGVFKVSSLKPGQTIHVWLTREHPVRISRMVYPIDRARGLEVVALDNTFKARTGRIADQRQGRMLVPLAQSDHRTVAVTERIKDSSPQKDALALLQPEPFYLSDAAGPAHSNPNDWILIPPTGSSPTKAIAHRHAPKRNLHTKKTFLKAPLRYARVSSGFSRSRFHPVYRVARPHLGIDYAAPIGTKVYAIGPGKVVFKGWASGYGQTVKIRHANGYVSHYGHLGRFAPKLAVGKKVERGQVIGYVGMTGVTTGPHLDFRISRNGRFVNPMHILGGKKPV